MRGSSAPPHTRCRPTLSRCPVLDPRFACRRAHLLCPAVHRPHEIAAPTPHLPRFLPVWGLWSFVSLPAGRRHVSHHSGTLLTLPLSSTPIPRPSPSRSLPLPSIPLSHYAHAHAHTHIPISIPIHIHAFNPTPTHALCIALLSYSRTLVPSRSPARHTCTTLPPRAPHTRTDASARYDCHGIRYAAASRRRCA